MYRKINWVFRCLVALGWALSVAEAQPSAPMAWGGDDVVLTIAGQIGAQRELQFSLQDLQALPQRQLATSTVVMDGVLNFQGVLVRDLLDSVSARGSVIEARAVNGYSADIPWADIQDFDVLLAWAVDGVMLDPGDKGPLWIVYPRDQSRRLRDIRYDYRWVWQLNRLTVK